ncbi:MULTISPECIES: hypothetical protein [Bacillaceae]|uniref:Uncharacterized protein n=1 Tax=Evansella alkalicola TaxID=745819 RepID=A0ABS6JZ03_9BACI|nr:MULTISPECIES: hypothetical protein [Bacillaceae]MBU9723819.1 hypothetical protein [Bacillus alkalicola]
MANNSVRLSLVRLKDIIPIYTESVSKKSLSVMINTLKQGDDFECKMVTEKDKEGKHWLKYGYSQYLAYMEVLSLEDEVTCLEKPYSNQTKQRIDILRNMFGNNKSAWVDKHKIICDLVEKNKSLIFIANEVGVSKKDIEQYLVHPDIPSWVIDAAVKNNASFITIENVRKLELPVSIKHWLYKKAVRKRNDGRLTHDKLEKVKWLLILEKFSKLNNLQKKNMVEEAFYFREKLENVWLEAIEGLEYKYDFSNLSYSFSPRSKTKEKKLIVLHKK